VRITLTEPWSSFPFALADEVGMITSPTALKKCDPSKPPAQCEFNLKPVGAGPFMIESFKPKDSINLVRNPTYWGGSVYLDGLKFVNLNDSGGQKTLEAYKTGSLNVAYLRDASATSAAREAGYPASTDMNHAGGVLLLNMGLPVMCSSGKPESVCAGKPDGATPVDVPTKDLKVRQAIVAAVDPKVLDQRGNGGKGFPGSELIQNDFRWYPGVPGPKYDPEQAKKLVAEAKAAGWNGRVRLLYNNTPLGSAVGLATQAMLQAVGIDAPLDTSKDTAAQVQQVAIQRDFDVAGWGLAITADDGAFASLAQNLGSASPSNRVGFKNAIFDQSLKDLRTAKSDDEKKAAFKRISEQVAAELPIFVWSKIESRIVYSQKLHGTQRNHSGVVLFHQAWLEK
jgi:peptide/nickel transport system substrate-binding protein